MALTLNLSWIDGQVSESRKLSFAYSHIPRIVAKQKLGNRKSFSFSYFFPCSLHILEKFLPIRKPKQTRFKGKVKDKCPQIAGGSFISSNYSCFKALFMPD